MSTNSNADAGSSTSTSICPLLSMDRDIYDDPWANYRLPTHMPGAYIPPASITAVGPQDGSATPRQAATTAYDIPTLNAPGGGGAAPLMPGQLRAIGDHLNTSSEGVGSGSSGIPATIELPSAPSAVVTAQQDRVPILQGELQNFEATFQSVPNNGSSNATVSMHTPGPAAGPATGAYAPSHSGTPTQPTTLTYNGQMFRPGAVPAPYSNLPGAGYYNNMTGWPENASAPLPSWNSAAAMVPPPNQFQGQYNTFFAPQQYTDIFGTTYNTGFNAGSLNFGQGFGDTWNQALGGTWGQIPYASPPNVLVGNRFMPAAATTASYPLVSQPFNTNGKSLQIPAPNAMAGRHRNSRSNASAGHQRSYGNLHNRGRTKRPVALPPSVSSGANQGQLSSCSQNSSLQVWPQEQSADAASFAPFSFRNQFQSADLRRQLSSGGQSMASNDPSETGSAYSYLPSQFSEPLPPPMSRPPGGGSGSGSSRMSRLGSSQSAPRLIAPNYVQAEPRHPTAAQSYVTPATSNTSQDPQTSSASSIRGKRRHPLSPKTKQNSNDCRNDKSVCIWCKLSGIGCHKVVDGSDVCQGCEERGTASTCIRFHYMELIDAVSTQFVARQYINQPLPDGDAGALPSMTRILEHALELSHTRDIRVVANGNRVCDLDLKKSYNFLTEMRSSLPSLEAVQPFVDAQASKDQWKECVLSGNGEPRPGPGRAEQQQTDPLRTLAMFDDVLPNRLTYRLVHKYNGDEEEVQPDTATNQLTLLIANLLTLIFGRQIEHAAFKSLHSRFPKHKKFNGDDLDQLAGRLFALRWRVSLGRRHLTELLFADPDLEAIELSLCITRLCELCRKLYFCFCCVRQKRLNNAALRNELGRDEHTHSYAGARRAVTERVPQHYSPAGFEQWMLDGEAMVQEADLAVQ